MRIWASRIGLIAITALVGLSIAWQILSLFMLYDDEGYVLHSLNEFARHGALYDQVFSQYGPLYYLVAGGAARWIGFEWTHDLSRVVTGLAWLATALAGGVLTTRLSSSRVAGAFGFIATSAHLGQMAHEPMHPGNLLTPLIAWGAVGSVVLWEKNRPHAFLIAVAALAAACAMVKINVGVFVAGAGGMWWWLNNSSEKLQRGSIGWAGILVTTLLPALLMYRHLNTEWGASFATLSIIAIGTVSVMSRQSGEHRFDGSHLTVAFVVGLGGVAMVAGGIMLTGTSWSALWQGVIVRPIQHADVYSFPANWPTGTIPFTLISLIGFVAINRSQAKLSSEKIAFINLIVRLGLAIAFVVWTFALPSKTVGGVMVVLAGSLGWLLISSGDQNPAKHQARLWTGLLLGWQFLHAYPVAGTQLTWGTFLWIPLLVTAVTESIRPYFRSSQTRPAIRITAAFGMLVAGLALIWNPLRAGYYYYSHAEPLNLPGAQLLRVPPHVGSGLRIISANAALHGDVLYSIPGSFSYNLWTQIPTPTGQNVTHWFTLLDRVAQNEIVDRLTDSGKAAWVVQPDLLKGSLSEPSTSDYAPLLQHWRDHYRSVLHIDGLQLHLPRDRAAVMINTANYYLVEGADQADRGMFEVSLVFPVGTQIAHVEIHTLETEESHHDSDHNWHASNTDVEIRRIYPQGVPVDQAVFHSVAWPITAEGLNQLRFYSSAPRPYFPLSKWWLKFINTNGDTIGEARFGIELP